MESESRSPQIVGTAPSDPVADPAAPAGAALSTRAMWAILGLVLLADALDMLDATVTNIAAPTIAQELNGGESLIKWLGTAYMLAMGALLVVGGRLGDRFGQRRLFLIGMAGFTLASAVAGVSSDPTLLIIARIAQGGLGALLIPQGMAIMTRSFTRKMLTRAFGLFGPLLGVATVGGPVLAGFIIDADVFGLSWRPIFLVNVVLGVAGIAIALRLLPRDQGDSAVKIDAWGSTLLGVAMFALLYGLIQGSSDGWTSSPVTATIVGVVFFAGFARRQVTASEPLIKATLFTNRGFSSGMVVGLAVFAATTGLVYVLSVFIQTGIGDSPRAAALALLPLSLGIIASAFAAMGGLVAKLGRTLIFIGLGIILAGCLWVLALVANDGTSVSLWAFAPAFIVVGIGMGFCYSTIFDVALGDISADEAGSASGSLSAIQQLAAGIGSAAITSVFFSAASAGPAHAMIVSLVVALVLVAVCLPLVALMPRRAPDQPPH